MKEGKYKQIGCLIMFFGTIIVWGSIGWFVYKLI